MRYALLAALLLSGCAALSPVKDVFRGEANESPDSGPLYQYRAELVISVNGTEREGVITSSLKGPLDITIRSSFALNRLQITSCARQEVFRGVDKNWWGQVSKKMTYHYVPSQNELDGPCPLYIEAFNKAGLVSWGFIAFKTIEDLPGQAICNGVKKEFTGYSVCQSKASLEQAINFPEDIEEFEAETSCAMTKVSPRTFKLRPNGVCRATFYAGGKWHTTTMFGYKRVLVMGE